MPTATEPKSWEEIEQLPKKEQLALLQRKLEKREPVERFSDIKVGDHLIKKTSMCGKVLYYHHFVCTKLESDGRRTIIHYHNTSSNASGECLSTSSFGSGCCGGKLASIKEITLPHKDLVESESELQKEGAEVERVVWPDELKCYPDQEVSKRAKGRLGEKDYDLEKNNCESFVMWCICGRNTSLQSAKPWLRKVLEVVNGGLVSFYQLGKNLPKVIVEIVEQDMGCSCLGNVIAEEGIESLSLIGCTAGVVVPLVIDVVSLVYSIWKTKQKWKSEVITREAFIQEVVGLVITGLFKFIGSVAGMFIGQIFIPIPFGGAIIGLFLGSLFGFWLGKRVSSLCLKRIASLWKSATPDIIQT
ncbi:Hypothetical predicted protein [Paramuricea clavata]|uniref:Uncharacterized protein n=1 Tax=Paramuricea clavata TaxID=317549 RepID=A0A6S7KF50_PARCT|nr:Hypothetical predicted protein [Paramuricea clavata]